MIDLSNQFKSSKDFWEKNTTKRRKSNGINIETITCIFRLETSNEGDIQLTSHGSKLAGSKQWPGADTMTLNIAVTARILICQRWFNGGHRHCNCFMVHIGACRKSQSVFLMDFFSPFCTGICASRCPNHRCISSKKNDLTTTSQRIRSCISCLVGGVNDPKVVYFRFCEFYYVLLVC